MTNWNMLTDDNGKEWLEFSGQVVVSPSPVWEKSTDQSGVTAVVLPPSSGMYTLDSLAALRNKMWDAANPSFTRYQPPGVYDSLVRDDGVEVRRDSGPIDGPGWRDLTTVTTWPNPLLPGARVMDTDWNQITGGRPEPEHPSGRFQNLDWEEAS